ncbi:hypothetical protein [Cryptosporangium aurantiacum]|uniref:Uncharacterized protein n=1 Tax=Cryptosporangium aurantiacum TaxID=134849 RepID=A0A1M7RJA2_9ACTN|nr:hypothetical protein [Cryptosporangium aurantiacum]SHN46232.1 hypothetical protein SAMN05443668_11465 [Cryptosporangium aurantiacum]
MNWIGDNKDVLAIVLSLTAVGVSLVTILLARRQARIDSYTRLHETLVSPAMGEGRRLLFLAAADDTFPAPADPAWDKINQALAIYDCAGVYYRNKLIPRQLFMESWHHPLANIKAPAEAFLNHAQRNSVRRTWVSLQNLLDEAAAYKSKDSCCT